MLSAKSVLTIALLACSSTITLAIRKPKVTHQDPAWFQRMSEEDMSGELRRCAKKTVAPTDGHACGRENKVCYFGDQICDEVGPHPEVMCVCSNLIWTCIPSICPDVSSINAPSPGDMMRSATIDNASLEVKTEENGFAVGEPLFLHPQDSPENLQQPLPLDLNDDLIVTALYEIADEP